MILLTMHKLKSNHINLNEKTRLYQCHIPIIALTGSIATGKSTVSEILKGLGLQVIDADKLVKEIYLENATLAFIQDLVPEAVNNGQINFQHLRSVFFENDEIKLKVENFIYQELPRFFNKALNKCNFDEWDFLIYDVPLLFEKDLIPFVDDFILVYTDEKTQLKRLLNRDNMEKDQANLIISTQISIETKRNKSKNIIKNLGNLQQLKLQTEELISKVTHSEKL